MGAEEHTSCGQEVEEQGRDDEPLLGGKQEGDVKVGETAISVSFDGADPERFTFRAGPRPWRDTAFSLLFAGTMLVTYAFGLFAVWNAEPDWNALERFARYNPESGQCEPIEHAYVGNTPTHVALIRGRKAAEDEGVNVGAIVAPVLTTVVLVVPVGLAMLWLLHRYTREIVWAVFALMCAIPVTVGVLFATVCLSSKTACSQASISNMSPPALISVGLLIMVSILSLIMFGMMCKNRSRVDLAIQILKTALQALKQNLSLLLLNPVLLAAAFVVIAPICVFIWYGFFNGHVAPNFDAIKDPASGCSQATGAPCCQFQPLGWVIPYLIVAYVALIWVLVIASQLQILVISGTISQWYFAPTGSLTVGTTKRSMRNAFGPSFGTACLSSLIITISMILRSLMDKVGAKIGDGIISVFLRACFSWLFQMFEFFTRFSTNFAAISGDSFTTAARSTFELLKRNFLSTVIVETVAHQVLFGITLMVSLAHSFIVFGAMYYFTATGPWYSLLMANVCFVISVLGLGQIYGVLSTVIDTVYICYAMDKDVGAVSKREVHDVYMLLPPAAPGDDTMLAVRRSEP